jgi:hypothetical protein
MVAGHDLNHLQQVQKILQAGREKTLKKSAR